MARKIFECDVDEIVKVYRSPSEYTVFKVTGNRQSIDTSVEIETDEEGVETSNEVETERTEVTALAWDPAETAFLDRGDRWFGRELEDRKAFATVHPCKTLPITKRDVSDAPEAVEDDDQEESF